MLSAMEETVGIRVGSTTPLAELNQLIIPAVRAMIGPAVTGFITEASRSAKRSIPPSSFVTAMRTLTPQIRINTLHGTSFSACFSLTVPSIIRIKDSVKQTRPTSNWNPTTATTIITSAIMQMT